MKKKFLAVMTMVFVFGLFATVFAVSRTGAEKAASCPMQSAQTKSAVNMDLSKVPVFISEENCCKPGADCCKGGVCCKKK